jgi:hypothetical protein
MSFSGLALLFYYKRPKPHMFVAKHLDEEEEFHGAIAPKVVTIRKKLQLLNNNNPSFDF